MLFHTSEDGPSGALAAVAHLQFIPRNARQPPLPGRLPGIRGANYLSIAGMDVSGIAFRTVTIRFRRGGSSRVFSGTPPAPYFSSDMVLAATCSSVWITYTYVPLARLPASNGTW